MIILVLGGTGATGRLVIKKLLTQGNEVIALVRNSSTLAPQERLTTITETALTIDKQQLSSILGTVDAVICCLGHNLSWRGVYGPPLMLVKNSIQRVVESLPEQRTSPLKLVLMNTTGNRNLDLNEAISLPQKIVLMILRCCLPPHLDNERSANLLRQDYKDNNKIEWIAVRPDGLVDEINVSAYTQHESPTRSAIFDAGKTSRINVADFMCQLVSDNELWTKWKGQMPVIYNDESSTA